MIIFIPLYTLLSYYGFKWRQKTSMGLLCIEEKNIVVLYTNPLFQLKHFTETKTDKPYLQPNIKYIHKNFKIDVIILIGIVFMWGKVFDKHKVDIPPTKLQNDKTKKCI